MSNNRYVLFAIAVFLLCSCARKEVYDWNWVNSLGKDYPAEFEPFNSRWTLAMTNVVDPDVYAFDGSGSLLSSYTEQPDVNEALRVADYLEKEIFPLFPEEIITRYMPSQIFVADSVYFEYYDESYDAEFNEKTQRWKQKHSIRDVRRLLYGDTGVNHLTLASRCLDDPSMVADLRFNWTSLLIERMLANTKVWPVMDGFVNYSETVYRDIETLSIYAYYQNTLSDGKNYFRCLGSDIEGDWCYWYYCGSVRGCRYFYTGRCIFTSEFMQASGSGTEPDLIQSWFRLTYRQDFADILAFMLLTTPEEREEFVSSKDGWSRTRKDETHVINREVYDRKFGMVRQYMKENFDWEIQ